MFDISKSIVGKKIGNVRVYHINDLEARLKELSVDIVILTMPKECTDDIVNRLLRTDVHGIWNFTGQELEPSDIVVENIHIGDSLMALCYGVAQRMDKGKEKET